MTAPFQAPLAPLPDEAAALAALLQETSVDAALRGRISTRATQMVRDLRGSGGPGMMELFLAEYGLSTEEGVALMSLAEALLRVPDSHTRDALIQDKIARHDWAGHLGHSGSWMVNASTLALTTAGKVLGEGSTGPLSGALHRAVKRVGEPAIRKAVGQVMEAAGRQFVLGETIEGATKRAATLEAKGVTHSYDMLGEAALTEADAQRYIAAYAKAIAHLASRVKGDDIRANPGISIKLSALFPRYETAQADRVMVDLVARTRDLARQAKAAGIGLNIDAEEAARLELSLDVIAAVMADPELAGWDGFGVVVQAYGLRAGEVIDWLYGLAGRLDRKIMVRLVKGAYWDAEIKRAQVEGLEGFPVYTQKASTDVSYICNAAKLLEMTDRIYPQFATHNAHTMAAILEMAPSKDVFEFQRLHGMGEELHALVRKAEGTRCRIYAPVGSYRDLLAYLVRRLLENGANSSFVHQIADENVAPEEIAADPFLAVEGWLAAPHNPAIDLPEGLFAPERPNSKGFDLDDPAELAGLAVAMEPFATKQYLAGPEGGEEHPVINPATGAEVGRVRRVTAEGAVAACDRARDWSDTPVAERAAILNRAADLYEAHAAEIFALLSREAGKVLADGVAELREAVDFLRYYAAQATASEAAPAGIFACISPWNFPLAIFTGQISAALATGNGVVAKPAEATCLTADLAVALLHEAGVPGDVLQLLPGTGAEVGGAITAHPRIAGVCFTGSTATAQRIHRTMADSLPAGAPLIAETGGLNAMIVDATALPEQAITDIIASSFQSAGQRCSALRVLYLQEDIAEGFLEMLYGAMDELRLGDPAQITTDVGPVIDAAAKAKIDAHVEAARTEGRLLRQIAAPGQGTFVGPAVIKVGGIEDLAEEIFGPVLHVATYRARDLDRVVEAVNGCGYGLTFGLHSRIGSRVADITSRIRVGNAYVNRNQIGAIVGSQPFGGEGLSGTGPKAGGPRYLTRFRAVEAPALPAPEGRAVSAEEIEAAFAALPVPTACLEEVELPGPTGEKNTLRTFARDRVLCLGPTAEAVAKQVAQARRLGCRAVGVAPGYGLGLDGVVTAEVLAALPDLAAVVSWQAEAGDIRRALAGRDGALVPLLADQDFTRWLVLERHCCINTAAAGGNAELLAG
ncbi:bifunctional proline dehydrogenase/L-glutamate gamma-semialdehyde dehydrogenase PutA [Maritimibacter alkaliphilus]|uniref:bifunctional proline dehydrogenase/L-glutamate gamma-semialdehyde dehydrogenase PutA n=1 Tax=Maritimibacter alkaliphilus TaxID=404236 RepID=UPI001C955BDB|nr:bifunctional proline dehydrogenase/L-glutamate gamma-semialdehyde dehydrogenase PutA [Maritimibacter alkaliphilus]MBY6091707.1 bifunctional proline dehydrogenase/L-glutamate gamma-semialdehyde dehydrogenase PutA [Maritimibacter alkaliphilus]